MNKVGGYRNFGWGKQMTWAGKQALNSVFGNGRFGTVAGHAARWRRFCDWAATASIHDATDIRVADLAQFASFISQKVDAGMSVSYGKNLVTSANVTMEALRGDKAVWVRPGAFIGQRSLVRQNAPESLERAKVQVAADRLASAGKSREAALVTLCREFGLRRREAALLPLRLAHMQARHLGRINVTEGTKGGRGKSVDRWVPAKDAAISALEHAIRAANGADKLIPPQATFGQWGTAVSKTWRNAAGPLDLGPLKDLRAAYACERYRELTGYEAPVVAGQRCAEKSVDRYARRQISQELGHNRIDVVAAYVGSAR